MKIAVLNPNSSEAVTRSMSSCLLDQQALTGHTIECFTLATAPEGIETDADVAQVAPMVADWVASHDADAYVIACFSDPGLTDARQRVDRPVFGIAESAYVRALVHGERFGVISLGPSSIARHRVMIERLGLASRLAGDRAVDMSVAEANDASAARAAVTRVALTLRDQDAADVLILGCAGMGQQRAALQEATGCIVIDPVQAAVSDALTAIDLKYYKEPVHA